MNMLSLFFVTIILSWWIHQQFKPFSKHLFQYGHISCSKTWIQAPDLKNPWMWQNHIQRCLWVWDITRQEGKYKLLQHTGQLNCKHNHACFPDQQFLLVWLTKWPTSSSPSRKGLEWWHPCVPSAGTGHSHWWHPIRWLLYPGTERVSPWDWPLSLQNSCHETDKITWEHTFSLSITRMINTRDTASPEVLSDWSMYIPAWDTFAIPDLTRFFTLTALSVPYSCLQPQLLPQPLSLPSSGYGQRPHLK